MKLEKGKISSSHLIFLIVGFTIGTSLIIPPGRVAKHDAWLAILVALLTGLILAFIYTTLAMRFPGKNLVQFNDIIYGPYLGKVISIGYLWFFFHTSTLNIRILGDFSLIIMPETPMVVFIILTALVCASVVRNGIEVITRCSVIVVPVTGGVILITTILLLKEMEFTNFLPILDLPLKEFIKASSGAVAFPFGQPVAFLMIFMFLNNIKQTRTSTILALIIAGLLLVTASVRNIAVLGGTAAIYTYPSYQAVRLINIGEILTRLEIIVVTNLLTMVFLKISVFYYGTVLGIAQLLKLRSYLPLVLPMGIFIINVSILQLNNIMEYFYFATEIWPYYSFPFQVGIPVLSLIIAMIRGVPKQEAGNRIQDIVDNASG